MDLFPLARPRIESLSWSHKFHTTVAVLRLDDIHPLVSGNKWFKLQYYLHEARQLGHTRLLTFGGSYSNHLLATAAAARGAGFSSTGIIRGEAPLRLSPTLRDAQALGMELQFLSRTCFDELARHPNTAETIADRRAYLIPNGGYGPLGAAGAATILDLEGVRGFDCIFTAVGTGTTLAGLASAARAQKIAGIPVLRNAHSLKSEIAALVPATHQDRWRLIEGYHFGGYARHRPELIRFMNELYESDALPTDFVYTGKLFYAVHDLLQRSNVFHGASILLIHSGGLQGNRSLRKGTLIF